MCFIFGVQQVSGRPRDPGGRGSDCSGRGDGRSYTGTTRPGDGEVRLPPRVMCKELSFPLHRLHGN